VLPVAEDIDLFIAASRKDIRLKCYRMYCPLRSYISRAICENLLSVDTWYRLSKKNKADLNIIASVLFWLSPLGRSTVRGNQIYFFIGG
jgi:hypothetical protein